jgi:hypothetical protein
MAAEYFQQGCACHINKIRTVMRQIQTWMVENIGATIDQNNLARKTNRHYLGAH